MNGEYLGMYTLAEKIEVGNGRVEIDQDDDVLFEYDNYAADEEIFGFQTEYTHAAKRGFRIHSPEVETLVEKNKSIIKIAESALFGKDTNLYSRYFDAESWAKMYLLQTYTMNSDAYYGSFYFYYDSEDGVCRTAFASISEQVHECRHHTNENAWKFISQFTR